jgi:bacterioferritin (cytochrome b1)
MPADPRMLEMLSHYRDAELHGASLLLRLLKMTRELPDVQVKLTLHVAQETRHAWLWTERIRELGGWPIEVSGYQTRIGMHTVPRAVVDLLALSIVVETRSLARYTEHAARSDVDARTAEILRAVTDDERWHVAWMQDELDRRTRDDPTARERVHALMERYRAIDEQVYAELSADERCAFGEPVPATKAERRRA